MCIRDSDVAEHLVEHGVSSPAGCLHVQRLVSVLVLLLVKVLERLGEACIHLHPRVRRPEVGRGADQGFNVGHKATT